MATSIRFPEETEKRLDRWGDIEQALSFTCFSFGFTSLSKSTLTGISPNLKGAKMKSFIFTRKISLSLILAGLLSAHALGAEEKTQPTSPVKVENLVSSGTSWDGTAYKNYPDGSPELSVLKMTIPAHSKLSWHKHPMPSAAYVLSGKLTLEKKESGQTKVLIAGQAFPEMMNEFHRGVTGDEPVELLIFYAGAKGLPMVQY